MLTPMTLHRLAVELGVETGSFEDFLDGYEDAAAHKDSKPTSHVPTKIASYKAGFNIGLAEDLILKAKSEVIPHQTTPAWVIK